MGVHKQTRHFYWFEYFGMRAECRIYVVQEVRWNYVPKFHSPFHMQPFMPAGVLEFCWFRHCATRRRVAGSITDWINGIFNWNPSGCTTALGWTHTSEYQGYLLGVKAAVAWGWQPCHRHVSTV